MEIQNGDNFLEILPEECFAIITSFTTPADACRLALVSKDMLSASESDDVWKHFLPSDIDLIVSRFDEQEAINIQSKKQLYKRLTNCPLHVDQFHMTFWLDCSTGKKCWMIGAWSLGIAWGEYPQYWRWSPVAGSWFPNAAELLRGWMLEIVATIHTSKLSPSTRNEAHLVFSMTENTDGFDQPFNASLGIAGNTVTEPVYFGVEPTTQRREGRTPARRANGWWEVMIGEFNSYDHGEEGDLVELSVSEIERMDNKRGIIIDGIEVRPASVA